MMHTSGRPPCSCNYAVMPCPEHGYVSVTAATAAHVSLMSPGCVGRHCAHDQKCTAPVVFLNGKRV